ncbi:short-chain fatty acyl-CoA regulator family protein, partial [Bradyrhizobium campsiandrae]|uniref:short-chain fatty acyl-CoA regulator family protein n=1 Tax=Bradyrhizobium campsiandrae TaxID=1729892 RepID=UPI0027B92F6B
GCEIRHAARLTYAAGIDLEKTEGTPIGVNCRLCERENCSQRAIAWIEKDLGALLAGHASAAAGPVIVHTLA